jgi:hypothetical protein
MDKINLNKLFNVNDLKLLKMSIITNFYSNFTIRIKLTIFAIRFFE